MNQRVMVIVLVAAFTTCFVSTGAIVTLKVIGSVVSSATAERPPKPVDPDEPEESLPPKVDPDDSPTASVDTEPIPEPDTEPTEPTNPTVEEVEFSAPLIGSAEFAVFHQDKAKLDPWVALQKAAKGTNVKVFQSPAPASAIPPYFELRDLPTDDYAVIGGATLAKGYGLTDAVKKALPNAKRVSVIDVTMPLGGVSLLETSKVMLAFARATGGVLWDEESAEYLSADQWKARRIDSWEKTVPNVSTSVKVYEDELEGDAVNLRTGGMKHLGLPELVLESVADGVKDDAKALLYAAAQTLAERKGPVTEGPLEVSIPKLKHAGFRKQLEGQTSKNAERSLEVELVGGDSSKRPMLLVTLPEGGNADQRVEAALDTFFGFGD
jgi:hypothetical protein